MITIIDYGLGNLKAFLNIYNSHNIPISIASKTEDLESASKIILPGVGSFDYAIEKLNKSGMRSKLNELVLNKKVSILGICIGMQIMAETSEEGKLKGLGWINAHVHKFKTQHDNNVKTNENFKKEKFLLPHMGWNSVKPSVDCKLFENINETNFYFLHSYYFQSHKFLYCKATTNYNINFCSAFSKENIYGVQFHPEKSHDYGEKLLLNFSKI